VRRRWRACGGWRGRGGAARSVGSRTVLIWSLQPCGGHNIEETLPSRSFAWRASSTIRVHSCANCRAVGRFFHYQFRHPVTHGASAALRTLVLAFERWRGDGGSTHRLCGRKWNLRAVEGGGSAGRWLHRHSRGIWRHCRGAKAEEASLLPSLGMATNSPEGEDCSSFRLATGISVGCRMCVPSCWGRLKKQQACSESMSLGGLT